LKKPIAYSSLTYRLQHCTRAAHIVFVIVLFDLTIA